MKGIKKSSAILRQGKSGYLPIHIWVDIFLRLPAEFILTVMCVCKEWYGIVTNPSFKNLFLQKSDDGYVIYLGDESFGLVSRKTLGVVLNYNYPIKEFSHMSIVGSVNGLLCLSDKEPLSPIYLVNPSIQKYRAISSSAVRSIRVDSVVLLGFGYHEPSKDYKIVRFVKTRGQTDVEVYSLSTNSWKFDVAIVFPWLSYKDDPSSFVLNERLHWLARNNWKENVVLTFHLGLDFLEEMKLPDYRPSDSFIAAESIGVLKGNITFFVYGILRNEVSLRFSIYMMKDYGMTESWSKMYLVCPEAMYISVAFIGHDQVIMEYLQDGICLCDMKNMCLCDMKKGECYKLQILDKRFRLQFAAYKESLVLLDQKKGLIEDHKIQSTEIRLLNEKCDRSSKRDVVN